MALENTAGLMVAFANGYRGEPSAQPLELDFGACMGCDNLQ